MGGTPKMFVREATGLVKEMRLIDQFFVSIRVFNPMFAFVIVPLVAPAFFPGVYLPLVYVIGAIPAFAVAVVYAILSKAMPRSGGDYVWTTRIIGPLFGSIQLVFIIGTMIILGRWIYNSPGGEFSVIPIIFLASRNHPIMRVFFQPRQTSLCLELVSA